MTCAPVDTMVSQMMQHAHGPDGELCMAGQTFRRMCLLEEPGLATVVEATAGQVFCVKRGAVVKACYDEIAKDASFAAADFGNVLLHTTEHGGIVPLVMHASQQSQESRSNGAGAGGLQRLARGLSWCTGVHFVPGR